jgi:sulfate permease, SulP family
MNPAHLIPITRWARGYRRQDTRSDLAAGLTVGAMLVLQAMAYALLIGLAPEAGLYASIVPVLVYASLGTSRQLAVGPVAIVSLLTASALGALVEQGAVEASSAGYASAAALLALMVGAFHLVLGFGRLGYLVNFLSHAVLVGFTAAAAIIIGFSQVKHVLGVAVPRRSTSTRPSARLCRRSAPSTPQHSCSGLYVCWRCSS